jgi:hypothetical protein
MSEDQTIFFVNLEKKITIAQFRDGRIQIGDPLSVKFHLSHRYFLQVKYY